MRTGPALLSLVLLSGVEVSQASTVTGRLDYVQGHKPLASRALVKPALDARLGRLKLYTEGFLEADALAELPYADERRVRAILQEAYAELDLLSVTLRLGLQPVRWSQSWSLPSMDYWTARRWDRYFLDPLPEQLKHPVGALARFVGSDFEVEAFASARTPQDSLPLGRVERGAEWRAEGGARAQFRVEGWDFSPTYAYVRQIHHTGFALSYALQSAVPKLEVGRSSEGSFFVVGGADFFFGAWSLLPQITLYRASTLDDFSHVSYLPVRYESGRNAFELQLLATKESERFLGGEYRRSLNDALVASVFLQDYQGAGSGLMSSFNTLVSGGWVGGLRLSAVLGF